MEGRHKKILHGSTIVPNGKHNLPSHCINLSYLDRVVFSADKAERWFLTSSNTSTNWKWDNINKEYLTEPSTTTSTAKPQCPYCPYCNGKLQGALPIHNEPVQLFKIITYEYILLEIMPSSAQTSAAVHPATLKSSNFTTPAVVLGVFLADFP
ncbi:hypothetical protein Cgig2_022581 [Carnegiea gigantea]|uniref:Uncharacterized protein n=1 Tax=Carnegiea gigantea TaxID=171969 RepID=A0A9Q1KIM2_9CARY|nr:hypothetical protein Cgig2_022581 [Carnegiea gigantea]